MIQNVAVYCSSSDALAEEYFAAAREVGQKIAEKKYRLVWGGADVGLLGEVARATQRAGGKVVGFIPKAIEKEKIVFVDADEIVVTEDLYTRKKMMGERADAFIALPGGFGTIEEIVEVMTLKQLQLHVKPIVLLNTRGFFDPLVALFEKMYEENIAKSAYRDLYYVTASVEDAFAYLETYVPVELPKKWFAKRVV